MIPRLTIWKSFWGLFWEDFSMSMVSFRNNFLPGAFPFVSGILSQLWGDCSFGNFCLKPNFITFFPTRNRSYPDRCGFYLSCAFRNRLPIIGFCCGNCGKAIYATITPVYIRVWGFKKGVAKNKIILSNVCDIEGMKGLFPIIVDC